MCLNIKDVETLFETKLDDKIGPIKTDIEDIKGALVSIIEIQKEQVKLEGQVIHLQETQKDSKDGLDIALQELRKIQADSSPKATCMTMFNNDRRDIDANSLKVSEHDKLIRDRTWQILFALISVGLTILAGLFITVAGGLILYLVKGGTL